MQVSPQVKQVMTGTVILQYCHTRVSSQHYMPAHVRGLRLNCSQPRRCLYWFPLSEKHIGIVVGLLVILLSCFHFVYSYSYRKRSGKIKIFGENPHCIFTPSLASFRIGLQNLFVEEKYFPCVTDHAFFFRSWWCKLMDTAYSL